MEPEQKFTLIPVEAAQALHQYLLTKPMGEVENIVNLLRSAQVVEAGQIKPKEEKAEVE